MKTLLTVLTATAALAAVSLPALAQPLSIIVRGGTPEVIPEAIFRGNDYNYGHPFDPGNPNFDPAAAAINAELAIHPRYRDFPINVTLASTLAFSTGSWTVHQERCQATHATYDPVSNTYLVDGLPVQCR